MDPNQEAIANFQTYLRIKTVQPDPDYDSAIEFLKDQSKQLGLKFTVIEPHPKKPTAILTWVGSEPDLPSVMLNSHIDVVPVFPEHWKYDPFSATIDEKGDIYARGSQDMKCVGIQYLEAIRRLKKIDFKPKRTIHVTFVPDEEIGGELGMCLFVKHDYFKSMNVGFCMDEGLASPTEIYPVYYGERNPWWVRIVCPGQPGHGSQFLPGTAGVKIRKVIDRFMDFRASEEKRLEDNPNLQLGDVTTVNLTKLEGGVQYNVVPAELVCGFDIRIPPTVDLDAFERQIRGWLKEAGDDIKLEFLQKSTDQCLTELNKEKNPWWSAFYDVTEKRGMQLQQTIFPAATDCRYLRALNIPALGFSPMNYTPVLLHDHNEFLNTNIFLNGIKFYEDLLPALTSVPSNN